MLSNVNKPKCFSFVSGSKVNLLTLGSDLISNLFPGAVQWLRMRDGTDMGKPLLCAVVKLAMTYMSDAVKDQLEAEARNKMRNVAFDKLDLLVANVANKDMVFLFLFDLLRKEFTPPRNIQKSKPVISVLRNSKFLEHVDMCKAKTTKKSLPQARTSYDILLEKFDYNIGPLDDYSAGEEQESLFRFASDGGRTLASIRSAVTAGRHISANATAIAKRKSNPSAAVSSNIAAMEKRQKTTAIPRPVVPRIPRSSEQDAFIEIAMESFKTAATQKLEQCVLEIQKAIENYDKTVEDIFITAAKSGQLAESVHSAALRKGQNNTSYHSSGRVDELASDCDDEGFASANVPKQKGVRANHRRKRDDSDEESGDAEDRNDDEMSDDSEDSEDSEDSDDSDDSEDDDSEDDEDDDSDDDEDTEDDKDAEDDKTRSSPFE